MHGLSQLIWMQDSSGASETPLLFDTNYQPKDIDKDFANIPVCLCSLVSGLCDSVAFNASSVFVSIRTGSAVYLALGAARLPADAPALWLRALCSIGAFVLGVLASSQTRRAGPTAKGTLVASFLAQALIFGGQIVASRQLGFNEVPANVLTSFYCDLFSSDPHILAPWSENPKRNRRASAAVLMVLGATVQGWLGQSDAGLSTALWIAGGVKYLIAVA
ncbi:hypothetical protein DL767_004566 [Monosporascus sp. MG133]|nr:hypothetical protein DL767_004566 [Monosporascus sp. MG133]